MSLSFSSEEVYLGDNIFSALMNETKSQRSVVQNSHESGCQYQATRSSVSSFARTAHSLSPELVRDVSKRPSFVPQCNVRTQANTHARYSYNGIQFHQHCVFIFIYEWIYVCHIFSDAISCEMRKCALFHMLQCVFVTRVPDFYCSLINVIKALTLFTV